jgi:hypothetical protein
LVHHRFEKGLNIKWFSCDVLAIYLSASLVSYGLFMIMPITDNRWWIFGYIGLTGFVVIFAGVLSSSMFWAKVKQWLSVIKPVELKLRD